MNFTSDVLVFFICLCFGIQMGQLKYYILSIQIVLGLNTVSKRSELPYKVKVKLSLCLTKPPAMKTYWGSGGIAPYILNLGTRWKSVVTFTPRPLYLWCKNHRHSSDRRLSGPQSWSGRGGEEKKFHHCLRRELIPGSPTCSLFTILTRIYRLTEYNIKNEENKKSMCFVSLTFLSVPVLKRFVSC
jgi:hypothetical protein